MPSPNDGTAGSIVEPIDPEAPEEADVADPGEVAEAKQVQRENNEGKYGAEPVVAHTPAQSNSEEDEEQPTSWIEIELKDEEDQPVAGEKYEITLPDDTVARGTLDPNGFARVEGIESGTCKVTFPELDQSAWEKAGS